MLLLLSNKELPSIIFIYMMVHHKISRIKKARFDPRPMCYPYGLAASSDGSSSCGACAGALPPNA